MISIELMIWTILGGMVWLFIRRKIFGRWIFLLMIACTFHVKSAIAQTYFSLGASPTVPFDGVGAIRWPKDVVFADAVSYTPTNLVGGGRTTYWWHSEPTQDPATEYGTAIVSFIKNEDGSFSGDCVVGRKVEMVAFTGAWYFIETDIATLTLPPDLSTLTVSRGAMSLTLPYQRKAGQTRVYYKEIAADGTYGSEFTGRYALGEVLINSYVAAAPTTSPTTAPVVEEPDPFTEEETSDVAELLKKLVWGPDKTIAGMITHIKDGTGNVLNQLIPTEQTETSPFIALKDYLIVTENDTVQLFKTGTFTGLVGGVRKLEFSTILTQANTLVMTPLSSGFTVFTKLGAIVKSFVSGLLIWFFIKRVFFYVKYALGTVTEVMAVEAVPVEQSETVEVQVSGGEL